MNQTKIKVLELYEYLMQDLEVTQDIYELLLSITELAGNKKRARQRADLVRTSLLEDEHIGLSPNKEN